MKELIKRYEEVQKLSNRLLREIEKGSDGFLYLTITYVNGNSYCTLYNNEFMVQLQCNNFNGDNGLIYVYTNNPNHNIITVDSDVVLLTLDELKTMGLEKTDMCEDYINWISK